MLLAAALVICYFWLLVRLGKHRKLHTKNSSSFGDKICAIFVNSDIAIFDILINIFNFRHILTNDHETLQTGTRQQNFAYMCVAFCRERRELVKGEKAKEGKAEEGLLTFCYWTFLPTAAHTHTCRGRWLLPKWTWMCTMQRWALRFCYAAESRLSPSTTNIILPQKGINSS